MEPELGENFSGAIQNALSQTKEDEKKSEEPVVENSKPEEEQKDASLSISGIIKPKEQNTEDEKSPECKDDEQPNENQNNEKIENNEQIQTPSESEEKKEDGQDGTVISRTMAVDIDIDADNKVKIVSTQENVEIPTEETQIPSENKEEDQETEKKEEETKSNQNEDEEATKDITTGSTEPPQANTLVKLQPTVISPTKKNGNIPKTLSRRQFIALMKGESAEKKRPKTVMKTRSLSSTVPSTKIPGYADEAIAGKNIHITDALAITDIIDELIGRKIQALDDNDYVQAHKIGEAMNKLRASYRVNDREALYNMVVNQLAQRKKAAEEDLSDSKRVWKDKWRDIEKKHKDEMDKLYERHVKEHEQFEEYWKDPANYSEFTKRTATQLEHIAVERALVIAGRFLEAEQFKKMNEKKEKSYKVEQSQKLQSKFEEERANLIRAQEDDVQKLKYQQENEKRLLSKQEKIEMDVKKLKLENVTRTLEDEKQFWNFCARTYKRDPSKVVPPTVSTRGGNDLPPMPPGRIFPRGVEDKVRLSKRPQTSPLSLPSLRFKRYKVPKYGEKPKTGDDEDM